MRREERENEMVEMDSRSVAKLVTLERERKEELKQV